MVKKGHKPWNKGIPRSDQIKKKISETKKRLYKEGKIVPWNKGKKGLQTAWNKGKKMSEATRKKLSLIKTNRKSPKISGHFHWNWQGGKTSLNNHLRKTIEWRIWRKAVFERDNYTCWICIKRGFKLHPHHLKEFFKYPKLRFKKSNGLTLCEFCHRTYTNFGCH